MKKITGFFLLFVFASDCSEKTSETNTTVSAPSVEVKTLQLTPTPKPTSPGITETIIWEGDSRVDEDTTTEPPALLAGLYKCNYVYPADTARNSIVKGAARKIVNIGQSGDTAQAIRAGELTQGDAQAEGSTIYILDAGGNDTGISGRSTAAIFADIQYIEGVQSTKGYRVYVATIADANIDSTARAKIHEINALIRAKYPANRIIDFARVQNLNKPTNTTYFRADGIHYTAAGKKLRATVAYAGLTGRGRNSPKKSR